VAELGRSFLFPFFFGPWDGLTDLKSVFARRKTMAQGPSREGR